MNDGDFFDKRIIKIGTRDSALAIAQTNLVIDYIKSFYNNAKFEIIPIKTTGDLIKDKPLYDLGGKKLFTKEIDFHLKCEKIDMAVHSAKDIDSELNLDFAFPLILPREDQSDCLISFKYKNLSEIPECGLIATCSLRRKEQLLLLRPDLKFEIIRGNIGTRIQKVKDNKEIDATILAYAGLKRINLEKYSAKKFTFQEIIPSACQGIIVAACLKKNSILKKLLNNITHKNSHIQFEIERTFIETLGASCQSSVGCTSYFLNENIIEMQFIVISQKKEILKKVLLRSEIKDALKDAKKISKELSEYL